MRVLESFDEHDVVMVAGLKMYQDLPYIVTKIFSCVALHTQVPAVLCAISETFNSVLTRGLVRVCRLEASSV